MRNATTTIRNKRAQRVAESPDWEDLRDAAEAIKDRTGRHLDVYLAQAEENLTKNGVQVHWARNAAEANEIVAQIAKAKGVDEVVKIKSITTQETDPTSTWRSRGSRPGDRPGRADRPVDTSPPPLAHRRPGDPPQPGRGP